MTSYSKKKKKNPTYLKSLKSYSNINTAEVVSGPHIFIHDILENEGSYEMSFFISHLLFSEKPLRSMLYRNIDYIGKIRNQITRSTRLFMLQYYIQFQLIRNFTNVIVIIVTIISHYNTD